MPWFLGIDEAGYGPNLGPFVMSSSLFHVPADGGNDLWKRLQLAVRRASQRADGRIIVDDSKQVYSPKLGIGPLERNLWPFLQMLGIAPPLDVKTFWGRAVLNDPAEVAHEPYLEWGHAMPLETCSTATAAILGGVLSRTQTRLEHLQSILVCPQEFNRITRQADSKAAIPIQSAGKLIQKAIRLCTDGDTVCITIDRLGGRMRYGHHVSNWFPQEEVKCLEEAPTISRYQVGERITISFLVEGDQNSLPVALASMLSKYWRELMMRQFNAWFEQHQPGIVPTAGYPGDAGRFWQDAEPTRKKLGLVDDDWWRER